MNRRGCYVVPDLPVREIISYFGGMGVEMAAAELLKPTPAATQRMYAAILELFVGVVPDTADESLQTMRQVQRMGAFLARIGMPGFTVRDLSPDSRRLVSVLSTVINFGMFRDNKRNVYERAGQRADASYAARKEYEARIAALHSETAACSTELSDNARKAAALEAEVNAHEDELRSLYCLQRDRAGEVALLKAEKVEAGDRLCAAQLLEHNLKQEIAVLRTQVVSDPTRLMELVGEMRLLVEKERESIKATEAAVSEGNARLGRAARVGETLSVAAGLAAALAETEARIEALDQEGVGAENRLRSWDSRINALKIRINHVDRQISHLQSKIFNLQSKDKRSSEEISSKIASLRIKYDAVSDERSQMVEKIRANNKKIQDLMYQRAKAGGEHEKDCSEVISLLIQLNSQIDSYFLGLSGCME